MIARSIASISRISPYVPHVHGERLDGTFAAGATISIGKARTAVLFRESRSTARVMSTCRAGRPMERVARGKHLGTIRLPELPANFACGDDHGADTLPRRADGRLPRAARHPRDPTELRLQDARRAAIVVA